MEGIGMDLNSAFFAFDGCRLAATEIDGSR